VSGRSAGLALVAMPLLLAACGGDERRSATESSRTATSATPPASAVPARRPARPVTIAALGDSITAGSPLWDPDPARRRARGDGVNEQSQYEYWARRRLGPNASFRNCGMFGDTTAQIARRLDRCARGAQILIVQGGINDVYRSIAVERSAANLRAMVRRARKLGLRVALTNLLPWNNGYPRYAAKIAHLNVLIARVGRDEHVPVLPFFQALEDPQRPGRMRADWTIDGDHPSVPGYRRLGEVVDLP
jgi:lysophospholipase L1-like esterase